MFGTCFKTFFLYWSIEDGIAWLTLQIDNSSNSQRNRQLRRFRVHKPWPCSVLYISFHGGIRWNCRPADHAVQTSCRHLLLWRISGGGYWSTAQIQIWFAHMASDWNGGQVYSSQAMVLAPGLETRKAGELKRVWECRYFSFSMLPKMLVHSKKVWTKIELFPFLAPRQPCLQQMRIFQRKPERSCNRCWPAKNAKSEEIFRDNYCIMLLYRSAWKTSAWKSLTRVMDLSGRQPSWFNTYFKLSEEKQQWLLTHLTMTMVNKHSKQTIALCCSAFMEPVCFCVCQANRWGWVPYELGAPGEFKSALNLRIFASFWR